MIWGWFGDGLGMIWGWFGDGLGMTGDWNLTGVLPGDCNQVAGGFCVTRKIAICLLPGNRGESFYRVKRPPHPPATPPDVFPSFLFTIALVIERKKLAPEARKQTRASEKLKMTSKSQLYVSHHFCLL